MLGSGRPFVLEIVSPRVRSLDLEAMTYQVNRSAKCKVEVSGLHLVTRDTVSLVKETKVAKTYRAHIVLSRPVEASILEAAVSRLVGRISQRTPTRVSHRRADLVRFRHLINCEVEAFLGQEADLTLCGEGGLYIKELVSGDEGRTTPSLSSILGVRAKVTELDVIDISDSAFPDLV